MEEKKIELTPEMAKKLKGFLAIDPKATFKYVLLKYREKNKEGEYVFPKELWPVFTLRARDGIEIAERKDIVGYARVRGEGVGGKIDSWDFIPTSGKLLLQTLRKGIVDVKNFRDNKGNIIQWRGADSIRCLSSETQSELEMAINERSVMTEEELRRLE